MAALDFGSNDMLVSVLVCPENSISYYFNILRSSPESVFSQQMKVAAAPEKVKLYIIDSP